MEIVECAAVRCPDGEIHTGHNHSSAYDAAGKDWLTTEWEEGFLTNEKRFVLRAEAHALAKKAQQIVPSEWNRRDTGKLDAYDLR